MSEVKKMLNDMIGQLKQERDELRVKLHLAGMEAKEEFERLAGQVEKLSDQYEPVRNAVEESAKGVFAALTLAAEEMKNGFVRVRDSFRDTDTPADG